MKHSVALMIAASTGALAQLKPLVNYPSGLSGTFDPGFWSSTIAPSFTSTQWTNGLVPEACVGNGQSNGCVSGGIEVFTVTYSDCPTPWTFCRCNNAQMTTNAMIDFFGRMPVGLRSKVRHPIAVPSGNGGCSAYAVLWGAPGDIVMQGACYSPSVWLHESGHELDSTAGNWNESPAFVGALAADTCAADGYGNGDRGEEFAQMVVLAHYQILKGTLPTEAYPGCLNNQLNATIARFSTELTPGGTCSGRAPDSTPISGTWLRRRVRNVIPKIEVDTFENLWVPPEYADLA